MIFYHISNCPRVPLRLKDVYGYLFLSFFLFLSLKVKISQYFRLTATFFLPFRLMVSLIETLL